MKKTRLFLILFLLTNLIWAEDYPYQNEKPEVIQLLLEAGYDLYDHPNYMLYTDPWSVLTSIKAPISFYEKLLLLGVKIEPASEHLMGAVYNDYLEAVNFFLAHGADVNAVDNQKQTSLHTAVDVEDTRILRRLIEAGAAVNVSDEHGQTPLHRSSKSKEKIEILLANGANINAVTIDGITVLMMAVRNPYCANDIVQTLIAGRTNINAADKNGQTALIIAARYTAKPEIITLLLNAGANAKLEDNTGRTALDWFDRNRHLSNSPVRKELRDKT